MPMLADATAAAGPADPVVDTANGRLRGRSVDGVHVFKGVRYADTTAGANRFLPPQPVPAWAGVQDAATLGASAPQRTVREHTDPFYSWYAGIRPVDEDCLFLNVWTPGLASSGASGRRPVMFWIHGGGWRDFSGTAPGFDGTALARAEDVVVVTVNHRLGAFGFLRLDGADERFADSGNAGLLDLAAALAWVRDNAAAFGGDPGNVTIFGESGGASKIAALLVMEAAHGLFHKAVLQSSGGGMRLALPDDAARQALGLARALGRESLDARTLQALPMATLLDALGSVSGTFRGTVDDRNLFAHPFADAAPAISSRVPLMAGCTNTETTYYLRLDPANLALDFTDVYRRLRRFLAVDPPRADAVVDAYRTAYPGYGASDVMAMVTSDFMFKRTNYRMAGLQAASASVPVYAYLFGRETPVEGGRLRSPHTSEVPFVFGTAAAAAACVGTGPDLEPMTRCMMATWAAFARTGDPNNPLVPRWLPYTDADRQIMVLDVPCRLEKDPGWQARDALDPLPFYGYGNSIPAFLSG